jgi:peptide/nickel transport system substrate-binding protein
MIFGDPPNLDPWLTTSSIAYTVSSIVYNGLLRLDAGAGADPNRPVIKPDLADTWTVSPDGLVYTFNLHPGVKWQNVPPLNGRLLTSTDVKYTLDRGRTEPGSIFKDLLSVVSAVDTPDPQTVKITLSKPYAQLLDVVASPTMAVVPKELGDLGELKTKAIGTGPFILDSYQTGVKLAFHANPDYFRTDASGRKLPYLNKVTYPIIADAATRLATYRSGQAQTGFTFATSDNYQDVLRNTPKTVMQLVPLLFNNFTVAMRVDNPPFNDVRVRRAFSLALDRTGLNQALYKGTGITQAYIPWSAFQDQPPLLSELGPWVAYDPAQAKRLLSEAGFPNGFETEILFYPYLPEVTHWVQLFQDQLRQVGVKMNIRQTELAPFIAEYNAGKYPALVLSSRTPLYQSLEAFARELYTNDSFNRYGVSNPDIDKLVDELRRGVDAARQQAIAKQLNGILFDQIYQIYFPRGPRTEAWSSTLHNYMETAWNGNQYQAWMAEKLWLST